MSRIYTIATKENIVNYYIQQQFSDSTANDRLHSPFKIL